MASFSPPHNLVIVYTSLCVFLTPPDSLESSGDFLCFFREYLYKMRCRHEKEQKQQQQQNKSPESQRPCFHVVSSWHCLLETAIHGQLDGRDAAPVTAAPAPTPQAQTYWIHVNEDVWCGCFLRVSFAFKDAERSSDDVYHLSSLTQCSELGGITQSL